MKISSFVALCLVPVIGLLVNENAQAQSVPARNPAPGPANYPQTGQAPAPPPAAMAPPPATQPAAPPPGPGTVIPQAAPQTVTAMPGQPYVIVDPATGQQVPVFTYGPVLRQRPAVLPYVQGSPAPRGYVLEEYHPRGLIIGGAVTLGVLYSISLSVAASNDFNRANGWLAVPVVGPFGWLATRKTPICGSGQYTYTCNEGDESSNRTMVALDGMGQVAGAAMLNRPDPHRRDCNADCGPGYHSQALAPNGTAGHSRRAVHIVIGFGA